MNLPVQKYQSEGAFVELLQLALRRAGYDTGSIDGIFGSNTQSALKRFQATAGLNPDGIAGPLTWTRLRPYLTGYRQHRISYGDTLYKLAKTFGTSVEAIRVANPNVSPSNLRLGSELIIPLGFAIVPTEIRYTSALLGLLVEGLGARYPFLRSGSAGNSVMGTPLYWLSPNIGAKKQVFYNASHHANEWITTPLLMKFIEELCSAYAFSGTLYGYSAKSLLEECTLSVIPLVNPDGVDLVNGAIDTGSVYYQGAVNISRRYPTIAFPSGWKANIVGTDPNLNYPAGWEEAREIKYAQGFTSPAPRDFVGENPLSAPESRAVYDFTLANDFALTLSYHTQGKVIYWKYLDFEPERSLIIGRTLAAVSGYTLEETPSESAYAGYKDWFIQTYNRPGYTVEAGSGKNPLPLSQFNDIYRENLGILVLSMDLA